MKRRFLHYDPHRKMFTDASDRTLPRLLTRDQVTLLQVLEEQNPPRGSEHHKPLHELANILLVHGH
ncbi:MAG: hypothetical protein LJE83_11430 [Gammaproteobacteria bacterium]|nr:hypothetical protein [Gammaproteobacteria bacterium]